MTVNQRQLYYVLHCPAGRPKAQILAAGPFASERAHAYASWVRWARFLADHGYEVMRFDYSGVGESTGQFEQMSFDDWLDDVCHTARFLDRRADGCPLILNGLGFGGLLVAKAFGKIPRADGLLLWSAPICGRDMLYDMLRLRLMTDFAVTGNTQRSSRDQYIAQLQAGKLVEVEGYHWSKRLWDQAASYQLELPDDAGVYRSVQLSTAVGPLAGGGAGRNAGPRARSRPQPLSPDLTDLFTENLHWLDQRVEQLRRPRP